MPRSRVPLFLVGFVLFLAVFALSWGILEAEAQLLGAFSWRE